MKIFLLFVLLVGPAVTAPPSKKSKDEKRTHTKNLLINDDIVYTTDYDIVNILATYNAFKPNIDDKAVPNIFFVEADLSSGVKEYKGLSVIRNKEVKKILETGTDIAAANDNIKLAYFGATDGLYIYNYDDNAAEKYGPITDSIISIAKVNGSEEIYILTDKNELYRVTEQGTKKELVSEVVGAQEIVLDYSNNLYYYGIDKKPYVFTEGTVKTIEGLPSEPSYIHLYKPSPFLIEDGVPVILDNKPGLIFANGNSLLITDHEVVKGWETKPSAYAIEGCVSIDIYAMHIFCIRYRF